MITKDLVKLFWLSGSYYKRKETIADIKSAIGSFQLHMYDEKFSGDYIESQILETGLFCDNKLVVLKDLPSYGGTTTTDNKKLIDLFGKIPDNVFVIIDGVPSTERPALYKAVKDLGKVLDFTLYLNRKEALNWMASRVREKGKLIDFSVVEYIVDAIGVEENSKGIDVDRLYVSLKKVLSFIGKRDEILMEDAIKSADKYDRFAMWGNSGSPEGKSLFEALDNKNLKQCYICVKNACEKDYVSSVAQKLFSVLLWRYRMLFFAKEASFGKNKADVAGYLQQSIVKFKKEDIGNFQRYTKEQNDKGEAVPTYSVGAINAATKGFYGKQPSISLYTREQLYRIMRCIGESFSKLRSNDITDPEIMSLFDSLFFTIIDVGIVEEDLASYRKLARQETF